MCFLYHCICYNRSFVSLTTISFTVGKHNSMGLNQLRRVFRLRIGKKRAGLNSMHMVDTQTLLNRQIYKYLFHGSCCSLMISCVCRFCTGMLSTKHNGKVSIPEIFDIYSGTTYTHAHMLVQACYRRLPYAFYIVFFCIGCFLRIKTFTLQERCTLRVLTMHVDLI